MRTPKTLLALALLLMLSSTALGQDLGANENFTVHPDADYCRFLGVPEEGVERCASIIGQMADVHTAAKRDGEFIDTPARDHWDVPESFTTGVQSFLESIFSSMFSKTEG